ncbi:hypothetical protein [Bacillus stercoris]|uniref:hypothetical protein n=1 Tax=Bacillus stercoris TaxID=2054641 RepID=UPI00220EAB5D|nr:metal-dependent phosphohydrolase [Bacillus phage PK-3]
MSLVTYRGTKFSYENPTPEMIDIFDILRSLPRLNRFVGHSKRAYSVGEHSLLCYQMADKLGYSPREKLLTLIHDFTEAYVGDCPAPLKALLPDFAIIEKRVEEAIYSHFNIKPPTEEEHRKVKRIDLTMLVIEMRDLTNHEWKSFINEHTYEEMLSEFQLSAKENSTDIYNQLFECLSEAVEQDYFYNAQG